MAGLVSCSEDERPAAEPEKENAVYILPTDEAKGINPVEYTVGATDKSYTYYLGREKSYTDLTVSIINNSDPIFNFPSTVTFKNGQSTAELTVTFNEVPAEGAPISFSIAPENAALYGLGYTKFDGSLHCLWSDLGMGQLYDALVLETSSSFAVQDVKILKNRLKETWRIVNPYGNKDALIASWGEACLGGQPCPYIEVNQYEKDGKKYLNWNKFWYSTLLYQGGAGYDIKGYLPSALSASLAADDLKSTWAEDKVMILYPYWYIDGLGGYGEYPVVVSLPGGPDLNKWLAD